MASSKARSRNRPARSASSRPAARTSAAAQALKPQADKPQADIAEAQQAGSQAGSNSQQGKSQAARARQQRRQPAGEPAVAEPVSPPGPPLWLQLVTTVLALAGLGVASYETWAHFNGSHLAACNGSGSENCTAVITSSQSMVFGVIPVAILGLVFYVFVVAIMSPWAWRIRSRRVDQLRLASMIAGMGFVMYLIYAELYQIGSWCLYCTFVHIITFILFCITVVAAALWGLGKPAKAA